MYLHQYQFIKNNVEILLCILYIWNFKTKKNVVTTVFCFNFIWGILLHIHAESLAYTTELIPMSQLIMFMTKWLCYKVWHTQWLVIMTSRQWRSRCLFICFSRQRCSFRGFKMELTTKQQFDFRFKSSVHYPYCQCVFISFVDF